MSLVIVGRTGQLGRAREGLQRPQHIAISFPARKNATSASERPCCLGENASIIGEAARLNQENPGNLSRCDVHCFFLRRIDRGFKTIPASTALRSMLCS